MGAVTAMIRSSRRGGGYCCVCIMLKSIVLSFHGRGPSPVYKSSRISTEDRARLYLIDLTIPTVDLKCRCGETKMPAG